MKRNLKNSSFAQVVRRSRRGQEREVMGVAGLVDVSQYLRHLVSVVRCACIPCCQYISSYDAEKMQIAAPHERREQQYTSLIFARGGI